MSPGTIDIHVETKCTRLTSRNIDDGIMRMMVDSIEAIID